MSLIYLLLFFAFIAFFVWLLETFIPMDPKFATLIRVVAIIFCILILLNALGLIGGAFGLQFPRLR